MPIRYKVYCRLQDSHFCLGLPIDFLVEWMALLQCFALTEAFSTSFCSSPWIQCFFGFFFFSLGFLFLWFILCLCVRKPTYEKAAYINEYLSIQWKRNSILIGNLCKHTYSVQQSVAHRVDERQRFAVREAKKKYTESREWERARERNSMERWSVLWYYCCFWYANILVFIFWFDIVCMHTM